MNKKEVFLSFSKESYRSWTPEWLTKRHDPCVVNEDRVVRLEKYSGSRKLYIYRKDPDGRIVIRKVSCNCGHCIGILLTVHQLCYYLFLLISGGWLFVRLAVMFNNYISFKVQNFCTVKEINMDGILKDFPRTF